MAIFEFKGSLIVPDVGYSVNEEISISNLKISNQFCLANL